MPNKPRVPTIQLSREAEWGLSAFIDVSVAAFILFDENLNYVGINPAESPIYLNESIPFWLSINALGY